MKPLKTIIDEVKIDIKAFSDDQRIVNLDEYIQEKADDIRATLIRAELTNSGSLDPKYYGNPVCCVEIECVQQSCEIHGVDIYSGTVLWKTNNLPALIGGVGDKDIIYLGSDNLQSSFKRVSLSGFANSDGDIWNSNNPMYFISGNIAYFKNLPTSGSKFICAIGLWQKPTSVCSYNLATDIYPVPSDYKLKILLKQDILKSWGFNLEDNKPNAKDESSVVQSSQNQAENAET